MVTMVDTKYFGIWKQREDCGWFICDANGHSEYHATEPTDVQVDEYRNRVMS